MEINTRSLQILKWPFKPSHAGHCIVSSGLKPFYDLCVGALNRFVRARRFQWMGNLKVSNSDNATKISSPQTCILRIWTCTQSVDPQEKVSCLRVALWILFCSQQGDSLLLCVGADRPSVFKKGCCACVHLCSWAFVLPSMKITKVYWFLWFQRFLAAKCFDFVVVWFLGFKIDWLIGFLVPRFQISKLQSFKDSETNKILSNTIVPTLPNVRFVCSGR